MILERKRKVFPTSGGYAWYHTTVLVDMHGITQLSWWILLLL